MSSAQEEMKLAVECGYWQLYRHDPRRENEGKNPFVLDSKEPVWSKFRGFLLGETRYTSLNHEFPGVAEELFAAAEKDAQRRYERYRKLAVEKGAGHLTHREPDGVKHGIGDHNHGIRFRQGPLR
jgi:pyruvate-ferredoxin/flavodoxin oxidoreductase